MYMFYSEVEQKMEFFKKKYQFFFRFVFVDHGVALWKEIVFFPDFRIGPEERR
jgi:hypothetical protein